MGLKITMDNINTCKCGKVTKVVSDGKKSVYCECGRGILIFK